MHSVGMTSLLRVKACVRTLPLEFKALSDTYRAEIGASQEAKASLFLLIQFQFLTRKDGT
jgi:hypothetical protein